MSDTLEAMRRAMLWLVGVALSAIAASAHAQLVDGVRVHLDATADVMLQQKKGREWIDACFAPCDRKLDGDARYRVEGDGVRPSSPFSLHATSLEGSETIVVTPAYDAARGAGFVLIGLGAGGVLVGSLLAWAGATGETCEGADNFPSTSECKTPFSFLVPIGIVVAVSSLLVSGIGTYLAIDNSQSSVRHEASISMKPRVRLLAGDRPFQWKGAAETNAIRSSSLAPMLVPIVSVSF